MQYGDLRPALDFIITKLKAIESNTDGSDQSPTASTSAMGDPATVPSGYRNLVVTKTNAPGTVTVTFPGGGTYVLSADGEEFKISGRLGEYSIALAGGASYRYYAY